MSDHYNLLGVPPGAGADEIRAAFRRLAKKSHPDAHPHATDQEKAAAQARFVQLARAYDVLSDPRRRQEYDRSRPSFARPRPEPRAAASAGSGEPAGAPPGGRPRPAPERATRGAGASRPRPKRPRAAPGGSANAAPGRTARPSRPPAGEFAGLGSDLEDLLRRFGLSSRSPAQRVWEALMAWAGERLRDASAPRAVPVQAEDPRAAQERRAENLELERELERLKKDVRSAPSRPRAAAGDKSVEDELAELKRTLGRT